MVKIKTKVVLDTNILISAAMFGGKPEEVLRMVLDKKIEGITSQVLLAEFQDVLIKTFKYDFISAKKFSKKLFQKLKLVTPEETIEIVRDKDDNQVLEAAVKGMCDFIITGDKDLLEIKRYKGIKIITPHGFLTEGK